MNLKLHPECMCCEESTCKGCNGNYAVRDRIKYLIQAKQMIIMRKDINRLIELAHIDHKIKQLQN